MSKILLRDLQPGDIAKLDDGFNTIVLRLWRVLEDDREMSNSYLAILNQDKFIGKGGTYNGYWVQDHQHLRILKNYKLNISND